MEKMGASPITPAISNAEFEECGVRNVQIVAFRCFGFDWRAISKQITDATMNLDEIRKIRNRAPFRPFNVHLTTGEVLPVDHPESMSLPQDEKELFVIWTKRDWNLIEAEQVARVSVQKRAAK